MTELRAAAERTLEDAKTIKGWGQMPFIQDAVQVCLAFLAEHQADDDDPLTVEWVNAKFTCIPGRGAIVSNVVSIFNTSKGWIASACKDGDDGDGAFCLAVLFTRGDVRRLVKALGIELNGDRSFLEKR